jgi:hypothetical protein
MLVPGHLIDRITNHRPTGITYRVYNKYDYLREKQEASNAWGIRLTRLVSGFELVKAENNEAWSTKRIPKASIRLFGQSS